MRSILFILVLACSAPAMARSLGVHGTLWDIDEEDGVAFIKRRVGELSQDGTVDKMRNDSVAKTKNSILHPAPVPGYAKTAMNQTRYFDPSITLGKSVTDASGRIIYPAGTRVNPLMYGGLSKRFVFIDARDARQIEFAVTDVKTHQNDLVVLVGGDWVEVSKRIGVQAYYDQAGALTKRFELSHVPSIMSQDGLRIKINEVVAP